MSDFWDEVYTKITQYRDSITSQAKRVLKKEIPKTPAIKIEIRDNLINLYNKANQYISDNWSYLDNDQRIIVKSIFLKYQDKINKAYQVLEINCTLENNFTEVIDPKLVFEDTNMPLTDLEFFTLASKLVTNTYTGETEHLTSFLDSVSLLKNYATGHEDKALSFIKTKTSGKARDLISDVKSLEEVIQTLQSKIKIQSSQSLITKLSNFKQVNRNNAAYAEELEKLTNTLKKSFISEGVPSNVAEKYTKDSLVQSISRNALSERTQVIIEAGTFSDSAEIINKLSSITENGNSNVSNIFAMHKYNHFNKYKNARNHYQSKTNQHSGRNNFNERNKHNYRSKKNYNRRYNNNNNSNNRNKRFVRYLESGNEANPQHSALGGANESATTDTTLAMNQIN